MINEDMFLPIGNDILALDPKRPEIVEKVKTLTSDTIANWTSQDTHDENIRRIELTELSYEEINAFHFHWTLAKNMPSIAKEGLISRVGRNSKRIDRDSDEAIYVSKGICGVLNCNDVWTKWRYNTSYNTIAAQFPFRIHRKLNNREYKTMLKYSFIIEDSLIDGSFLEDTEKINAVFDFQMAEQLNSRYLAVSIQPGIDYNIREEDRKKISASMVAYARAIYGEGVSTDFETPYAEDWNIFTPLGMHKVIAPSRLAVLTVSGREDMLSVLDFIYHAYGIHCIKNNITPLNLKTLERFISYCRENRE